MTKKFFSTMVALAIFVGVFGLLRFAHAQDSDAPTTTTDVGNTAPIITVTPSDGGSNTGNAVGDPTDSGSDVTFTITAKDVNNDDYYGAFCSSDAITAGSGGAPSCETNDEWVVSAATTSDSGTSSSTTVYTTGTNSDAESNDCTNNEECPWYAFVCDNASTGLCFPGDGSGDQGSALGTVTFSDVPVDEATLTFGSVVYEFDTTDGSTCAGGNVDVCLDISSAEDGQDTATVLADGENNANLTAYARGAVVYLYANTAGADGNSITMSKSGDTGSDITLSGTTLSGGDDDNASPFAINHAPDIVSYAYGDTAGTSGLNHATGTVEPGDTVYFSVQVTDADVQGGQDTVDMYVCADGDTFVSGTGCSGTEICSDTSVDPTSEYAECSSSTIADVPTADATYNVEVFVEDQHQYQATDSASGPGQTYDVEDVAPVLDTTFDTSGYTATDSPSPTAGGSDTVDFSFGIRDDNGDNDITNATGVFFHNSVTSGCTSDENDCYYDTTCTLGNVSSPGSGKLADGQDEFADASCQVTVYFNASDGAWDVAGKATDAADEVTFADASSSLNNPVLQGIDVVEGTIAYGTVAIGGTSPGQETSIGNVGNQVLDVQITGDDMCTDYDTCSGSTIAVGQQKWHNTTSDFDWDAEATDPGPWVLLDTAGSDSYDETEGCANRDIAVRENHSSVTGTNESVYWKIRIPDAQEAGSYTGSNTFTSTASNTCSGTLN